MVVSRGESRNIDKPPTHSDDDMDQVAGKKWVKSEWMKELTSSINDMFIKLISTCCNLR